MSATNEVNVARVIAIATLLLSVTAAGFVYVAQQPQIDVLAQRLADDESTLRSEDVAFADVPRVRSERDALAARYRVLFTRSPEAVFLRELGATLRRHDVALISTTVAPQPLATPAHGDASALVEPIRLALLLRGSYRHLLAAVADLSAGSEIVEVEAPSFQRKDDALVADVPVTIFEPAAAAGSGKPSP